MSQYPGLDCTGCTACCKRDSVFLAPGDDPGLYETVTKGGRTWLAPRDDGKPGCRYLGPNGCAIHAKRPQMCRLFDCRVWFASMSRNARRARVNSGRSSKRMFEAGRERLHTLD